MGNGTEQPRATTVNPFTKLFNSGHIVVSVGTHDPLTARLIELAGSSQCEESGNCRMTKQSPLRRVFHTWHISA